MKNKFQTLQKNEKDSRKWGMVYWGSWVNVSPGKKWRGNGTGGKVTSQGWPGHVYKVNLISEHWLDWERRGRWVHEGTWKAANKRLSASGKFLCLFSRQLRKPMRLWEGEVKSELFNAAPKKVLFRWMQWVFHHFAIMMKLGVT